MPTFIIQSRPDAQGVRTFYTMATDPRRAPYAARLRDEFLTKVGTSREGNVVATCYDIDPTALFTAGAVMAARGTVNLSDMPGDTTPGAWTWEAKRDKILGIA